jgi:hypothetical protein
MTRERTTRTRTRRRAERRAEPAEQRFAEVRERFGGIDTPAALGGLFAAIGVLVLLATALAVTAIPFQINLFGTEGEVTEIGIAGVAVATFVVLTAFLVGGWAAARIARFNGVINGMGVALWMLLLVAVSAAVGIFLDARYNIFQRAGLPDWFSQIRGDDVTNLALLAAIVGVGAVIIGSVIGGAAGESYNRRVNTAIVDTYPSERPEEDPDWADRDRDRSEADRDWAEGDI